MSDSWGSNGLQPARLPCPSPTPGACLNSCPSNQWCHPTISSSVIPFSSCLQSFPVSGFFLISQFFASGGQSIKFLKVLKLCLNFIFCLLLMFLIPSFCPWTCYTHCVAADAAAKSHQSCLTLCDPRRQPTRLPCPWDSPGKNTGVGCHFLLQCMKVKSESEVTQ